MCVPCTEKYPQLAPVKAKTPSSDQSRDRMQQQPHPSDRRPAGQDQNLGRSQSKVPPSGPQKDVPHPVPAPRRLPDSQQQEQQSTPHQQQQKRQQLQQQPMQQHQQPQLQQQHHPQQQAQQHSQQQLQQHPQQQIQQHPQQQLQQHPQQLQQHQQKPLQQQPLQQHSQQPLQQHPQQPLQQHPQQPLQHQHQPQQFQQHPPQHHHQQRPPPQQQQQQHPSQHQQRQPQQQQQHIQQQQLMQHGAASGVREAAPPSDRPVPPATLPRTKSRESSHQAGLSRECPPTVNNGKVQESAAPRAKHQTFEAERPKDETAGITTVSHVPEATRVSDYDVNSHKRNGRQHARSNQDIIINTTEEPHKERPPGVGHSNFRRLEGAPGQTSGRYIRELKRQLYRYEELASLYAPEQIPRKQESQPCPDQNVPHPSVDKIRNGSQRVAKEYRHDTSGPPEGVIYQQQLTQPQTMAEDSTTSVPTHQDSISRRKLPVIDKGRQMSETPTRHEKSKKDNQEQQMPSETVPSSIHHAPRTSMPESVTYEDRVTERRDGQSSLPRTVPLTSLNQTLQQQQVSHPQPKEQQLVQQQAQIVKQRNEQQQLKQRSGLPQQPLNEQQLKQLSQQQVYEAAQKQQQQQNQQLLQKQSAPQQQHFQQQQQQMKQTQEQFYMQQNQQHFKQQVVGSEAHHIQSEVQFKQQQLMRHLQQANQIPQRQQPPPPPVHPMQEQQPLRYPVDQSQKHQISQQQNKQQSNQQYPVPSVQQQGLQRQGEQYRQQQILPQNLPSDRQQALRRQEVPQETQVTPYQQVPKLQNQNMIQREVISSQLTYQKQQDRKACTNPFLIMSETEFDEDKVKKSYANGRSGAGPIVSEQTRTKLQSDHDADNILSDTVVKDSVMHRAPMTGKEEPQLIQDHRKGKPLPPKDVEQDLEEYQDEEEEEDIDDYFQLIENAIGVRKPQVIPGGKKSSEIQKQLLMTKETAKGSSQNLDYNQIQNKGQVVSKQMDIYNQQQQQLQHKAKQNRVNHVEEVKSSGSYPSKHISQYDNKDAMNEGIYEELNSTQIYHIRQPPDSLRDTKDKDLIIKKDSAYSTQPDLYQRSSYGLQTIPEDFSKQKQSSMMDSAYGGTAYDKYLKHELMADNTQPSVKHYLEEHKTKPIPYEVFSSTKALQSQQRVAEASENGIDIYRSQPSYTVSQMGGKEDSKSRSSQGYGYSGENVSYQVQRDADIYDPNKTANQQIPGVSAKPNNIDLQGQKKPKPKPDPQDWSPVSDLSPIMDVSPSVEAAEQELMEKYREKDVQEREEDDDESRPLIQANIPRATSGTISGMLEEFNRALGLPGSSPVDDSAIKTAVSPTSLAMSPISAGSSITSMSTVHQQEGLSRGVVPQKTTPQHPTQVQHGSPVKTVPATSQPGTPRRSHRRLPQPTMEQMQMAVAMAAQGPKERASSQESVLPGSAMVMEDAIFPETTTASTSGITSPLPSATSIRPVSPMMPWKTEEITQTFEQAFKHQTRERSSSLTEELKDHHAASSPETSASVTRPYPIPAARTSITTTAASTVVTGTTLPSSIYGAGIPTTMSATSTTDATYNNIHSRRMKPYNEFRTSKSLEETTRSSSPSLYVSTNAVTEIATTEGSPQTPSTPREKGGDSSDTQSEAESIKSVRMRRKLPTLPPDARSSPSPTRKTLERNRASPAPSDHEQQGEKEQNHEGNHQVTESDILSSVPSSVSSQLPPTTSATVLSSASAVTTTTTTVTTATSITVGLTTTTAESTRLSPNPNLSPSPLTRTHSPSRSPSHLSSGSPSPSRRADLSPAMSTPGAPSMRTPSPLSTSEASPKVADSSSSAGSKLPQYMQTLKQQLRDELKAVTEERKVMMELKHKDRDLVSVSETVSPQPPASSQPYQYSVTQQPRPDDDNTIMTTATTTVVSSVPQRYEIKPTAHRKQSYPTSTTSIFGPLPGSTLTTGSLRRQPSPRTSPQASPKKGRRRHTSEITMPPYSPMREALEAQSAEIAKIQAQHQIHRHQQQYLPHQLQHIQQQTQVMGGSMKSLEFESLDGHVRGPADIMMMRSTKYGGSLGSGLGPESVHHRGLPIKTAVPGFTGLMADQMEEQRILGPDAYFQTLNNEINRLRRSSEAIQDSMYDMSSWDRGSPQTTDRRKRKEKKPKKPRSWHPSPYVSEDEDDQMTREEKKAKIKAEIARRRQQIEENTRLHEELYKLARRRDRSDHMANTPTYKPSPTEMIYSSPRPVEMPVMSRIPSSMSGETQVMLPSDDTSSVLKAIDEILRKDLYSGPMSRVSWANYNTPDVRPPATAYTSAPSSYVTMPRTRYDYKMTPEQESRGWYTELSTTSPTTVFPDCSAEDESIARIASTFPTDDSAPPDLLMSTPCATFDPICEFSPVTTDTETPTDADATPAMPLLPDMPTRSRKLLENLGSSPIVGQPARSSSSQSMYQERLEPDRPIPPQEQQTSRRVSDPSVTMPRPSRRNPRMPVSKTTQKYDFPVKRILLTRDPKDRSVSGNGLGMKVVGGKEVPGTNGIIGAYVAKIFPGGVVETLGEVKEGDQVIEWNGIPLTGKTYEEVQRIIASSSDEVEIVIRCDLNMLETDALSQQRRSPGLNMGCPGGSLDPPDTPGSGARTSGTSPAQSPYSPVGSSRGHSPALTKRMMGGGGGGGSGSGTVGGGGGGGSIGGSIVTQGSMNGNCLSNTSSYDNLHSPEPEKSSDYCLYEYTPSPLESATTAAPIGQGESGVVTLYSAHNPQTWSDIYPSPPRSTDDDDVKDPWLTENSMDEVQVGFGPRAAIVYVPIIPVRPLVAVKENGYITQPFVERTSIPKRSMDHIPDKHPLLRSSNPEWKTSELQQPHLGVKLWNYDLLPPKNSVGKVSLYLNGLKDNDIPDFPSLCKLQTAPNGFHCPRRFVEEIDNKADAKERANTVSTANERPRAPQDLPGLKPVFVNDWKKPKKSKDSGNDDNNNNNNTNDKGTKKSKPPVGSSPEATPYHILPKGCRGSFCVLL